MARGVPSDFARQQDFFHRVLSGGLHGATGVGQRTPCRSLRSRLAGRSAPRRLRGQQVWRRSGGSGRSSWEVKFGIGDGKSVVENRQIWHFSAQLV
eukprot:5242400-Pyramimonas_sp.AAC.1